MYMLLFFVQLRNPNRFVTRPNAILYFNSNVHQLHISIMNAGAPSGGLLPLTL